MPEVNPLTTELFLGSSCSISLQATAMQAREKWRLTGLAICLFIYMWTGTTATVGHTWTADG
jgi:hypothetical protein